MQELAVNSQLHFCVFGQAEKLIREQLALCETATLLCCLGDVTGEPQHYHRAWELSGRKNARCQRALAYYYFNKEQVLQVLY